jgi:isoquinoline 1-oxidoreductase beta subunit
VKPIRKVDRRTFLKTTGGAAAGLLLGFHLPGIQKAAAQSGGGSAQMNAYIRIAPDDTVTLFIHKAEMGQGTVTSLAMLLAEELECDWTKVRTEFPGVDPAAYGPLQGVVGSQSVRTSWEMLRKAGAVACEMLVQAAAEQWGVARSQCRAENSTVINLATNARLTYGRLAEPASRLTVPPAAALKDPSMFRIVGKPMKRLDTPAKVSGNATFALDVRLPGMLHAVISRCPVFGGKVIGFDAAKSMAIPGVKRVLQISSGVAVLAENTWAAIEGRKVLAVQCDEGSNANRSSAEIRRIFAELIEKPGATARSEGDAMAALAGTARKVEAVYEVPYLAHAPMEPLNCTADVRADGCDVWAGTQMQTPARQLAAMISGLAPEKVRIHTTFLGGGFGRRARTDFVGEAVEISKTAGVPVQLTWTREDDIQQDFYRPASYTRFSAGLDTDGWPIAWTARIACPSFGGLRNGVDRTGVEGIADIQYDIPNVHVDYHAPDVGIPVSYWRSVGYSQNTFFTESFIDELAVAGRKDPVEFRRRLLAKSPRLLGVLNAAAEKAGWGKPLPSGRFRGVALSDNVGSFSAQVAEISIDKGAVRVHRVTCAVDCGHVVNPAGVMQQVRSGVVYGMSAALKGAITIDKGRVQQGNFHQYEVLRIDAMPVIDVHIVPSTNAPGGIGEASTPSTAPAIANAIFAATGKRLRQLPISATNLA